MYINQKIKPKVLTTTDGTAVPKAFLNLTIASNGAAGFEK